MYRPEEESQRELQWSLELKRELSLSEREFLDMELKHAHSHHENMANIMEKYPDFKILFIDATDKGTVGSNFFKELDPELLNYLSLIHTGQEFSKTKFDYKNFSEQLFRYILGFKLDDPRFETIRTIDLNSPVPETTSQYDLVVGSGGEVDYIDTQPEYVEQLKKIKAILKQVISDKTPFLVTCATHQIIGEVIYELNGGVDSIIDNLHDEDGNEITESGVVDLFLTNNAHDNSLTAELPEKFSVMSNHGQYLTELPKGAISLASNRFRGSPVTTQLVGYEHGIGIQAHFEFSPVINLARHRLARAVSAWSGLDLPPLAEVDSRPTWEAREIIFPKIIEFAAKAKQNKTA